MENLLQANVNKVFKLCGFETKLNEKIKGYDISVLATSDRYDLKVAAICISRSQLDPKSLIHMWSSQGEEIKADKVLLVFYESKIGKEEKALAENKGVVVWNSEDLQRNLDIAIDKREGAFENILSSLGVKLEKKIAVTKKKAMDEIAKDERRDKRLKLLGGESKKEEVVSEKLTPEKARYGEVLRYRHLHFYHTLSLIVMIMGVLFGGLAYYLNHSNFVFVYIGLGILIISGMLFLVVLNKLADMKARYPHIVEEDKNYCERGM